MVGPVVTLLGLMLATVVAAAPEVIFYDDFATVTGWSANNAKAPAEFSTDGRWLTLTDPPGGEVTWGTSIMRDLGVIDLDRFPWLVVRVPALTGGFSVTINRTNPSGKVGGLCALRSPGLAVCNLREATGWSGPTELKLGLYVQGTEQTVQVDWVKIVSELLPEERSLVPFTVPTRPVQPHHGLHRLARRMAWRPLDDFERNGIWPSERVVYTDPVTGNMVWQMTVDPGVDQPVYYDLPLWNADGSLLMVKTARGRDRYWLMDGDGGRLRPMFRAQGGDLPNLYNGYWSVREPNVWFASRRTEHGTEVLRYDIVSGETTVVARTARPGLSLMPPHPAEQHFLLGTNGPADADCTVVVVGLDGSEQVVPIGGKYHRLRFTKAPDLSVFFNRDNPRTQWVILPDGSGLTELPDPGSHPDWTVDGTELTYFAHGGVYAVNRRAERRLLFETGSGGHGGPSSDSRFFIADQYAGGLYPRMVLYARADGSQVVHPLAYHGNTLMSHSDQSRHHPDHHSTHPHPGFSPDGTKAFFASFHSRAYVDLMVAVCRYPDPPGEVRLQPEGEAGTLRWQPPARRRELAGYVVYGSAQSGLNYHPLHAGLLTETAFDLAKADGPRPRFVQVVAVEYSGLTSVPSPEVVLAPQPDAVRWYAEAEDGEFALPVREYLDQSACSNGQAIGLADATEGAATVRVPVSLAVGRQPLWLRVRGTGRVAIADGPALDAPAGWHWLPAGEVEVTPPAVEVAVRLLGPDVRLDKVAVGPTAPAELVDRRFAPSPRLATDLPRVTAKALPGGYVEVDWRVTDGRHINWFNVYQVDGPEDAVSQADRIGSPARPPFIDWGQRPGQWLTYRVTAVDRFGHESPPSAPVTVETAPATWTTIELTPATCSQVNAGMEQDVHEGRPVLRQLPGRNGDGCSMGWTLTVPTTGRYAVWVEHLTPGPSQSRRASIRWDNAEATHQFQLFGGFGEFVWAAVTSQPTSTPMLFELTAGEHQLNLALSGDGKAIARVLVTNNPTLMPPTHGALAGLGEEGGG